MKEGSEAGGKEATERASPEPIGGPEEVGDQDFKELRLS